MASGIMNNPNQVTTIPLIINTDIGVTGSGFVTICGRIATVSVLINLASTGTNIGAAWIPGQAGGIYGKYCPTETRWLSCDFYMNNVTATAEAQITTDGVIKINSPISGKDFKISGTWVTQG